MERARYCCNSAVRGYHIYQDIWEANYGELLSCARETGNVFDPFAVCVAVYVCFRSDSWGGVPRYLATCCGLIFVEGVYHEMHKNLYTSKISTRMVYSDLPNVYTTYSYSILLPACLLTYITFCTCTVEPL